MLKKLIYIEILLLSFVVKAQDLPFFKTPNLIETLHENGPVNLDFSNGFDGWEYAHGFNGGVDPVELTKSVRNSLEGAASTVIHPNDPSMSEFIDLNIDKINYPPSNFSNYLQLGNSSASSNVDALYQKFIVTKESRFLNLSIANVLQDAGTGHDSFQQPRFEIALFDANELTAGIQNPTAPCSYFTVNGQDAGEVTNFKVTDDNDFRYRDWNSFGYDLSELEGDTLVLMIVSFDCSFGGHHSYSFFTGEVSSESFVVTGDQCVGQDLFFAYPLLGNFSDDNASWELRGPGIDDDDPVTSSNLLFFNKFSLPGNYTLSLVYSIQNTFCDELVQGTITEEIVIFDNCDPPECARCIKTFAPIPGKDYVVSAWVKEANFVGVANFDQAKIKLTFDGSDEEFVLSPKDQIIDGWQRIEEKVTIPTDAEVIHIDLVNLSSNGQEVYFDDIRFHPFNSNMKSFVYDPSTWRLWAELDERNYATFYEYDEEGALVRVKKETERGVKTIQESRNSIRKQLND